MRRPPSALPCGRPGRARPLRVAYTAHRDGGGGMVVDVELLGDSLPQRWLVGDGWPGQHLGLDYPTERRVAADLARDVHPFDHAPHPAATVPAEPVGEHGPGRPAADDHDVDLAGHFANPAATCPISVANGMSRAA